jgi:hypothetical protein
MATTEWSAYDEGYLQAYQWSAALAGGAQLPQVQSPVQLGPGEIAHFELAPVSLWGYFGEQRDASSGFVLLGGPVGWALTGAASYAHHQTKKREAERAAIPKWHSLGPADILMTNQRLVLTGNGQTQSFMYAEAGSIDPATGSGGMPAVQFQPSGAPPLRLDSPYAPVLWVFVRFLLDRAAPGVPVPEGLLQRAQAQGRLAQA